MDYPPAKFENAVPGGAPKSFDYLYPGLLRLRHAEIAVLQ